MRAPLEDEANVPESEDRKQANRSDERTPLGGKEFGGAIEKNSEAQNEKRGERNKKAIAIGRDAGPIGITGDKKVESEKGCEKGSAGAVLPAPENEKTNDGEHKNGRPGEQSVIGGEEDS